MKKFSYKPAIVAFIVVKTAVAVYNVYNLIPKFDKFEGVDADKLINSVNSRYAVDE